MVGYNRVEEKIKTKIEKAVVEMRREVVQLTYDAGTTGAHIGGSLSLIEIMATLYLGVLRYNLDDMNIEDRDRVIFSKGHGALALYTAMYHAGIIEKNDLMQYKKDDSCLSAHPAMNERIGIEFSSGSLGQGLSLAVGVSLALKMKKNQTSQIYVILGDGECNEGSVWEAAQSAAHFNCNNIVAIVDFNKLQYDGRTKDIMRDEPFADKWKSFGWEVININGHDIDEIYNALNSVYNKPLVILAHTIKGKGISFMEDNTLWHNHALSAQQYELAMSELGE